MSDNNTTENRNPSPALGQVWRGNNPRYGYGAMENATIIDISSSGKRIILRFKSGNDHSTMPEFLNERHLWFFVSHKENQSND